MVDTTTSVSFITKYRFVPLYSLHYGQTDSSILIDSSTHVNVVTEDGRHDFGRHDQTLLVSLVVMGVIVPSIFIFMFVMICLKHRLTQQSRRSTMLLRNGSELPVDDIPLSIRTNLENGRL